MGGCFFLRWAASVLTGILFGIAPAIQGSRANVNAVLTEGGRGGTAGRAARRLRSALVVMEIAMALLVLIGAGLLMRSFARLRRVDPGFQAQGLLTLRVPLGGGRNNAIERRVAFFQLVSERVAALPGVRSVGAVSALPLTGLGGGSVFLDRRASHPAAGAEADRRDARRNSRLLPDDGNSADGGAII